MSGSVPGGNVGAPFAADFGGVEPAEADLAGVDEGVRDSRVMFE